MRRKPAPLELIGRHHLVRRACRVVQNDGARIPPDDDDVMECLWTIFDEGNDGAAEAELAPNELGRAGNPNRFPPAFNERAGQRIGPDAASPPIDQRREILGIDPTLSPVPQHHRCGRAAAQRFGLRKERHVQQRQAW